MNLWRLGSNALSDFFFFPNDAKYSVDLLCEIVLMSLFFLFVPTLSFVQTSYPRCPRNWKNLKYVLVNLSLACARLSVIRDERKGRWANFSGDLERSGQGEAFSFRSPTFSRVSTSSPLRMSEFFSSTMFQFLDLILNLDSKSRNSQTIYR